MKIVQYLPGIRIEQGGVVRSVLDWCTVFARRGHQVTLLTYQGNDLPPQWLKGEDPTMPRAIVLPEPRLPGRLLSRTALGLAEPVISAADILHLHGPWLDGNRQLARVARRHGVPYGVSLHGMLDDWTMSRRAGRKRLYLRLFGRRFLRRAAWVHCTAEQELVQAGKWFSNPKSVVLPVLVNLDPFVQLPRPQAGIDLLPPALRDRRRILFLGRLHEQKGVDRLIQAAAVLRSGNVGPFALVIAGNGEPAYERHLKQLAANLQLLDSVHFLGLVQGAAKLSVYQSAELFVLPTRHENFGLVLIEAMACGTPVITTRGTDIWPQIESAGGVVCDEDVPSIAQAMAQALGRPAPDLATDGLRARAWVFSQFDTAALASRYEQLYRSAIPTAPRADPN